MVKALNTPSCMRDKGALDSWESDDDSLMDETRCERGYIDDLHMGQTFFMGFFPILLNVSQESGRGAS